MKYKDNFWGPVVLILLALFLLSGIQGCVAMNGAKQGIFGGIPAVENSKNCDSIYISIYMGENDSCTSNQTAIGYLSGLHVALTVGLFVVNPIIGGAYLGANAIYGFARNVGNQ